MLTGRLRITALLKVKASIAKAMSGTPIEERARGRRGASNAARARQQELCRDAPALSFPHSPPFQIDAHSWAKLRDRLRWVSAHRKSTQIKIASRTCCAPACVFPVRGNEFDGGSDEPVSKRRNMHLKLIAYLESLYEVLAEIESQEHIVQIDQGEKRDVW